jgi:transcriptional regulator with XRE-family HTH domain
MDWKELRESFGFTPEEEELIELEKSLILAVVEAREEKGLSQKQLSELCGIKQPVIARLEKAVHSPQLNSIIRILKPMGYTLAVVKESKSKGAKSKGTKSKGTKSVSA